MFKNNDELSIAQRQRLALKLRPIFIARLSLVDSLENKAYAYHDNIFKLVLDEDEIILSDFIREYASTIGPEIFVSNKDYDILKDVTAEELTKMTRALSIGDVSKNSLRQSNLLTFQMDSLYFNPFDNTLLNSQFQGAQNLSSVIQSTSDLDKELYANFDKLDHHYVLKQPMVSSIMLISFLKEIKVFSERENENLFLTSYFKDIGMSFVSRDAWNSSKLNDFSVGSLSNHSDSSFKILDGRIGLSKKYLNIIKNHNHLNQKINAKQASKGSDKDIDNTIYGIETVLVNAIDIFVAMINTRPYRSSYTPYKALEFLRILIADDYPQEYRALVKFSIKFLQK